MPIRDRSAEEVCRVACNGEDDPYMFIRGTVTLDKGRSARYAIQASLTHPVQYWVMDLERKPREDVIFLLVYRHEEEGFMITDPLPDGHQNFPPCDASRILWREQALRSGLTDDLFALVDEVLLNDEDVMMHCNEWQRVLYYHQIGPFYAADARLLVPRLLKDEVPCQIYLLKGEDWHLSDCEELQKAETRDICTIYIPREWEESARHHERKLFPDGTLYFQEFDQGGEGWLDEETDAENDRLEAMRQLDYDIADLQRQRLALREEIDAVEKEIVDPASWWRLEALQRAQAENRRNLSRIEAALLVAEQRWQQLQLPDPTDIS